MDLYDALNAGRAKAEAQEKMLADEEQAMKDAAKRTNLWDYVKDITSRKGTHADYQGYVPHVVNKHFSFSSRTVAFANEMNKYPQLPNEVQFQFLRLTIPNLGKAFIKWPKKEEDDRIELIQKVYKYSYDKAKQVVDLLTPEQFEELRQSQNKGGLG